MAELDPVIERGIAESTAGEVAPASKAKEDQASYKMIGDKRIPVSQHFGKVVQGRKQQAVSAWKNLRERWDEALKYYNNDQMEHRQSRVGASGNMYFARKLNEQHSETENIVFSNVNTLVTLIYAKNPKAEITANNKALAGLASVLEKLVYTLSGMESAPGFNLKAKMRQSIVLACLTNAAYAESGYTQKQDSSEVALNDLARISKELAEATDTKTIKELEGQLMALEDQLNVLNPSGPLVRSRPPHDLLIDPSSVAPDNSDANWMMVADYLPTAYLNAKFGQKAEDGKYMSIYKPTHVLTGSTDDAQKMVETFKLFDSNAEAGAYGFGNKEAMKDAERTLVWYYWDKITRRVYMFADNSWAWPIWVYDDPYKLPRFFPFRRLAFHTPPIGCQSQGEVTYYLDQQDAINEMNDSFRRARLWAKHHIVYDLTKIDADTVEKVLNGPTNNALGIKLAADQKIGDVIMSIVPPDVKYKELFDKQDKYQAIDRIASVNEIMRGAQFKTNTTNKAIDYYSASQNTKLDDKLDAIEDYIGGIFADIAFMCLQFMDATTVADLIGELPEGVVWKQMSAEEIRRSFTFRCVGGSTQKPTSAVKKEEALKVGQILGQFTNSAPTAVLTIVLRLFQEAFDEINIGPQDWQLIMQEASSRMQQEAGGPPEQPQPQQPPEPNRVDTKVNLDPGKILQQVAPLLQQMDPKMLQGIVASMQRGVPIQEVIQTLLQSLTGGSNAQVH